LESTPRLPAVWVHDGQQVSTASLSNFSALDERGLLTQIHMAYVFDGTTTRRVIAPSYTVSGGTGITLVGSGWGHGVGMSQHGAQGMALLGFSYRDILYHYYTGVEIR
jgi:SpoIID/LytB domain protein